MRRSDPPSFRLLPGPLRLGVLAGLIAVSSAAAEAADGLPDYFLESAGLSAAPGVAVDLAAGRLNPAMVPLADHGGLSLGWSRHEDPRGDRGARRDDFQALLSGRWLHLGVQTFDREAGGVDSRLSEWTLGIGAGDRDHALGLSWTWIGHDDEGVARHPRLSLGTVARQRRLSTALAAHWDLRTGRWLYAADLGIRPAGPRWTLFGEIVTDSEDFLDRPRAGVGLAAHALCGLRLSARWRDGGELLVGLGLGLGGTGRVTATAGSLAGGGETRSVGAQLGGHVDPSLGRLLPGRGTAVPEMHLKGPMPYRRYRFLDDRRTLLPTLAALARMAEDPRVAGVVLNLSGMRISRAMLDELADQLRGLRAAGRTVTVYFDRLGFFGYALAAQADVVWMDPQGRLELSGLSLGRTYYHRALEKLGVGVDEWRYFTFKSAFEVLSRTGPSEADRRQRQALVDDWYEHGRGRVVEARRLSAADFDRIVDHVGVVLADEALQEGLVDRVGGWEEAKDAARERAREGRPRAGGTDPGVGLAPVLGDPVWSGQEWGEPDRIAVLYAVGPCEMDSGIEGRRLSRAVEAAREDDRVKAVVLRVDSPGGDPLPSDLVARALRRAARDKPVVVSQGNVAASGGYWLSMEADRIYALPTTLTGSIGVIGGWLWDDGLGEKLGLDHAQVQRGAHADLGGGMRLPLLGITVPERPLDAEEAARVETILTAMYEDFVGRVARARDLAPAYVDSVGQGRVWSGSRGVDLGLIDAAGGLWPALAFAKARAGLAPDHPVQLDEGPSLGLLNLEALLPDLVPGVAATALDPLGGGVRARFGPASGLSQDERDYLEAVFGAPGRPVLRMPPIQVEDGDVGP